MRGSEEDVGKSVEGLDGRHDLEKCVMEDFPKCTAAENKMFVATGIAIVSRIAILTVARKMEMRSIAEIKSKRSMLKMNVKVAVSKVNLLATQITRS